MAPRRPVPPRPDDEARIRKALGGAAAPRGLKERVLAALDAVEARETAERRRAARGRPPGRTARSRPRRSGR